MSDSLVKTVYLEGFYIDKKGRKLPYSLWTAPYLSKESADRLYKVYSDESFPLVTDPKMMIYGKECIAHRRVRFFSDVSSGYKFAGQTAESLPLNTHRSLGKQLRRINRRLGTEFNGILINEYRNGSENIGKHSDDERTLSNGGTSRTFRIRDKETGEIVKDIQTEHGQLLVMDGAFQKAFKHEIPPRKKIKAGRVSLTFRVHVEDK